MGVGFVMLAHQDLDRAAQVAAYWAQNDCPVVIHVDARSDDGAFEGMKTTLAPYKNIRFTERRACDWGKFSIVAATQQSCEILLKDFPEVGHVFLASGSCLPLKPVHELNAYLAENAETDFIESVTTLVVVDDNDVFKWFHGGASY